MSSFSTSTTSPTTTSGLIGSTLGTQSPSASISPSAYNGTSPGFDGDGPGSSMNTLRSVLFFLGFLVIMVTAFYAIYLGRRNRRRFRHPESDPEMAETGDGTRANSTWRPDTSDEDGPPQYRAYMLDRPYADAGVAIVCPHQAHLGTQQGLVQHLAIIQQQQLLNQDPQDPFRHLLTTTTTTTTTTTSTTMTSPPAQDSTNDNIVASTLNSSAETTSDDAAASEDHSPVVHDLAVHETEITPVQPAAQSHTHTHHAFPGGRHISILLGLRGGSNSNRNSRSSWSSRSNTSGSSPLTSPTASRSTSPARSPSTIAAAAAGHNLLSIPTLALGSRHSSPRTSTDSHDVNLSRSNSNGNRMLEVAHPPGLYRLRSSGPPPYIPQTQAEAPPLPPSYNALIVQEDAEPEVVVESPTTVETTDAEAPANHHQSSLVVPEVTASA
ncbi:hypothetical protein BGZ83_009983 [Gryganskiella cystojenkinii]|nr:hypothetical protein BGZ83_009983 [Gryganskiella cystojenkinii]